MTHAVMAFGRMNPPTTGHEKLIKKVHSHAKKVGGSAHIIASHSEGSSDNPIPQKHKIGYIKKIAPAGVNVSGSSKSSPNLLHHAAKLHGEGHEHLTVVAGSDRKKEFHSLLHRYNGKKGAHGHYNFKSINVVSSGRRDPDSHGTSGVSGTSMRGHARSGDHASFKKGLPKALHPHQKEITDHINSVKEEKEMSAAGKKGMADFQKKQERMRLKKLGTNYEKSRRKTNTFGYGSYGPKQFAEANLPPHLAKFVDKKGDLKPEAAKRVQKARKKSMFKIIDRTPKGYGNEPENSTPAPWKDARVTKEEVELENIMPNLKPTPFKQRESKRKDRRDAPHMQSKQRKLRNRFVDAKLTRAYGKKVDYKRNVNESVLGDERAKRRKSTSGNANDEHATAHIWNHMTSLGIAHDKDKMHAELDNATNNSSHPLHPNNTPAEGWIGKNLDPNDRKLDHHQQEYRTAVDTVHNMMQHPHFQDAAKKKHNAIVAGATSVKDEISQTWKDHDAHTSGATSKGDIHIGPKDNEHEGHRVSLKKPGGSQAGSGGPEETNALHHHAATQMLADHPGTDKEKKEIHASIMSRSKAAGEALNKMRTAETSAQKQVHRKEAQSHYDSIHHEHPKMTPLIRKEATSGHGKFGGGSGSATHLVTGGSPENGGHVTHVDDHDYSGSPFRAALPKGRGRSGNAKLDIAKRKPVQEARKSPLQKLKDFDKVRVAVGKKPIFKSNEKKVKPMKEEVDPHIKTMISKGDSDEKIKKMHPEITDDELKSCRQKYVKEELELQEVLTLMQRMKRSRTMRRFSKKIARRKSILSKRIAPKKNLAKRARRAAVRLARKKYAGKKGQQYNKLSIGDKMMVDKRIATKKLIIGKIAKRLMPKVRKAELTRLRSKGKKKVTAVKGSAAREQFDYENQLWEFVKHFDNIKVKDLAAIEEKAIKSGLDVDVLMEVFDRGLEDWDEKSGTLSPEQHAFNRLNSFIASGKARELDEDLIEEDKEKTGHSIDLFGKHIRRGEAESKTAFDIGQKHGSEGKPSKPKEHGIYQKHYKAGYNSGKQKIKEDLEDKPGSKKRTPAGVTPGYMAGKGKTFFQNRKDLADRGIKSKPIDKDKFFGKKKVKEDHDVNSLFLEFQATGERSSVADPIDPKKVNWKVKRGDSYLPFKHKRMPEEVEVGKTFKKGDTVTPSIGPHKGVKHEVMHDHGDGSYNIKPVGLQPKQIRYSMGATKAKAKHLELHNEDTRPYEEAIDRSVALANLRRMQKKVETKQTAKKVEKYVKEKGVTKVPPGEPKGIESQKIRPRKRISTSTLRHRDVGGRKNRTDRTTTDWDKFGRYNKEETEVDEGKIAGSIRWVRKWKAEGHSKEEAHRKAKEMDIHPKVVDDHYKKNNDRPGMGLHLLNRQNENVEKAELKVQHAKDKLTLAKDHKSDKARLRRMKDV